MNSIPIWRRPAARLVALGALAAATLAVTASPAAAGSIPPGGMAVEHASLDWTGSTVMQSPLHGIFRNYFSAGSSDGTEATYEGADGNAEVLLEAEGPDAVASWATRTNFGPEAGHHQVVRLLDGSGRIEADGSARITWDATFSVNFYSGMVPFAVADPTLTIAPDGSGELTATLSGCAADQSDPDAGCVPFTPAPGARVATFAGVQVDPGAPLTIAPDYAGVEVSTEGAAGQDRETEGWGAWPQAMVTFQDQTGLSSYFYSSGSTEDPSKSPLPFVVDLDGPAPNPPSADQPPASAPPATGPAPAGGAAPASRPARLAALEGLRKAGRHGVVKLARIVCPRGAGPCRIVVPRRIGVKIGGKRYVLRVMAPKRIAPGKWVTVRVHLPRAVRAALGAKRVLVKLRIAVRANGHVTKRLVKVKVAGRR